MSHVRKIPYWDPCLHGWTIDDGKLVPVWFEGNRVPDEDDESDDDEDEDEDNDSDSDSDSDSDDEED